MQELINRAKELLANGTVARVLGWKKGDLSYNCEPAFFETAEDMENFVAPLRERIKEVEADSAYLSKVAKIGNEKARESAIKTLKEVREIIGFRNI